jgi:hypothetical protein
VTEDRSKVSGCRMLVDAMASDLLRKRGEECGGLYADAFYLAIEFFTEDNKLSIRSGAGDSGRENWAPRMLGVCSIYRIARATRYVVIWRRAYLHNDQKNLMV